MQELYDGKRQLEKSTLPLIAAAVAELKLSPAQRQRTIVRLDAGGGSDHNISTLLAQQFCLLTKFHHWKRCHNLAQTVQEWQPDPAHPHREYGLVTQPRDYGYNSVQVAVRYRNKKGAFAYHVLFSTVPLAGLCQLTGLPLPTDADDWFWAAAILRAYDRRSGGIETSFKADKQALGIQRRNKRRFQAQEMLLLLAQLAHNILTWMTLPLRQLPQFHRLGHFRLIRDFFHIAGFILVGPLAVYLNSDHPFASIWSAHAHGYLLVYEMYLYLDKI